MKAACRTFRLLWDLIWLRSRREPQAAPEDERAAIRVVTIAIISLLVACFQYYLARSMFLLAGSGLDPTGLLPSAPEGVLAVFLALGGGLGLMLGVFRANDVLYLRSDLDWVMGLPLDRRGIVLARAAETALGVVGPVALMSGPATVAYSLLYGAWHAPVLYPLFLIALSALVSTAAVLVVILVGRLATTTRAREAMGLVGSILAAALYLLFMHRSPMGPANLIDMLSQGMVRALSSPAAAFAAVLAMPAVWPALAFHFITWGPVSAGVLVALAGISGTAGAVWLLVTAGAGAYARGLGLSGARSRRARRPGRPATGRIAVRRVPVRAGVLSALMKRDWIILARSPRLWQPMAMPLAWVVYMCFTRSIWGFDPLMRGALAAVAASLTGGTLSWMSFGVEGSSFFHVSTLPLSPVSRVISKVLVFALLPAALGLIMTGVLVWGTGTAADLLRAAALVITAAVTMTAVGVMMTVGDTNFEAVNPAQWQSGPAGCLSGLLMGVVMALAYVVLRAARSLGPWLGITPGAADTLGVSLLAAVCLGALVPGAVRKAAAAVRARERGAPPPI